MVIEKIYTDTLNYILRAPVTYWQQIPAMFPVQNTYCHHYSLLHGPVMEKHARFYKKQLKKELLLNGKCINK